MTLAVMALPEPLRTRAEYGARLEPAGGILHGAGQDPVGFADYARAVGRTPAVSMHYWGLARLAAGWGDALRRQLDERYPAGVLPQIGLSFTSDGAPWRCYARRVAQGAFDDEIAALVEALARMQRPVLLRIGYEFNGHWNGYAAEDFLGAWHRIAAAVRASGLPVALVWCAAFEHHPRGTPQPIPWDFWPGGDAVDWCGVDLFSPEELTSPHLDAFLARCAAERKPVLIGESTPRFVGADGGEASWAGWFAPYLRVIARNPGIKGFCYINWDWATWSAKYGQSWGDWGDARIERDALVRERWSAALADPAFRHG